MRVFLLFIVCGSAGCWRSQPKNLEPAQLDPIAAAQSAMAEYDSDHDGKIRGSELSSCPGLKAAMRKTDSNRDGALSEDEIVARLQFFVDSRAALRNFQMTVTVNRQPVEGLSVTLKPETFLTPAIEPAVGTTNHLGLAYPMVEFDDPEIVKQGISGVRPGMYRLEISKTDANGKESIPAKYNTDSNLGVEVGLDDHAPPLKIDISARL